MAGEQGDAAVAVTGQVLGDDTAARGVVHEDPVDLAAVHIAVEQHERHPGLEEVIDRRGLHGRRRKDDAVDGAAAQRLQITGPRAVGLGAAGQQDRAVPGRAELLMQGGDLLRVERG
ncbi:hypothetical protein [Streptomyces sp. KL116D]|uniref:hypothetical protein n=1 Tax=Streptomyces sp. KL116D TaxID=3045152 RepID=UPI003556DB29